MPLPLNIISRKDSSNVESFYFFSYSLRNCNKNETYVHYGAYTRQRSVIKSALFIVGRRDTMFNQTWKRPKIQLPKTKTEWVWDIVGFSCYLASILFLVLNWNTLPDRVPAHYNALGEVDRWGSKMELLILPLIGAFLIILMQVFEKFPETHNYPDRMNESNVESFYLLSRKLINQLKNICLIIFALILVESVSIALGWWGGLGIWFLPLLILGTLFPIMRYIFKQRKIQ
jgi:uncharacterized membrane protein